MKSSEKKLLEKNIFRFYLISLFSNAGFHLVVYTIFILSKGFTMQQFFLIESAYFITTLLFEIPTGIFADKVGRKQSLLISSLIGIPTIIPIILSNSFIVVLTFMAIGGISSSFTSGADSAMLFDTLKATGREKEFKKINGKMKWYGAWSGAIGGIVGGIASQFSLSYAWWLSFFVGIPILITQIGLVEPPITRKIKTSHFSHLKDSLRHSFTKDSGFFVIYTSVIWLFFSLGFWLWQPYLNLIGLPVLYFGFFYAAERLISGYASKKSHEIEKKLGIRKTLLLTPLILSTAFILESSFVFILGFLFIFLQSIASGYFSPVTEDYINSRIPSSNRATILSIKNMLSSVLFATISPMLGYFLDIYSLTTGFFFMGIMLCITSFVFFFLWRK